MGMFRRTILLTLVLASSFATTWAAIEAESTGDNQTPPTRGVLPEESVAPAGASVTATTVIIVIVLALVVVALVVALVARKH